MDTSTNSTFGPYSWLIVAALNALVTLVSLSRTSYEAKERSARILVSANELPPGVDAFPYGAATAGKIYLTAHAIFAGRRSLIRLLTRSIWPHGHLILFVIMVLSSPIS
jgi:hypothetical protein